MNSFLEWLDNEIKKAQLFKEQEKVNGNFETAVHFDIQQLAYEQCRANYVEREQ